MLGYLFLLFVLVPLVDLYVLVRIGQILTFGPTVAIVVLTGIVGASLARRQGLRTLARINAEIQAGRMPAGELADGLLILLAGAVLITPGFLTDGLGLLLLVPWFRRGFRGVLAKYFQSRINITRMGPGGPMEPGGSGSGVAGPESGPFGPFQQPFGSDAGPGTAKHVKNEAIDRQPDEQ